MIKAIKTAQDLTVGTFALAVGLTLLTSSPATAATTAAVTATVTAQNISVSVTDGSISYGTIALSSNGDTTSNGINDSQTATNNGNVTQDINIRGANSAAWTLAASAGADQYAHKFCTTTCDTSPSWTALTTSYATLTAGVAASGTQVFDLQILTPSSSSSYSQQSVDVTVQAVAS
jgi:hypothetical protein